jgi:hypothetical protein
MAFTEWTVLPHEPIEKIAANLWTVSGTMPKGHQRRMVMARLEDGRVLIHNAIAMDEVEMAELDSWGEVAAIIAPNAFHRQDAAIYQARYPRAKVYAPAQAAKSVSRVTPVAGDFSAIPQDATVQAKHLDGLKEREGVLRVVTGNETRLVFNDALLNYPKKGGVMGYIVGPTGRPSVPRFARWMFINDKRAFGNHLRRIAEPELAAIIFGHGENVLEDAPEVLSGLAESL